MTTSLIGRHCCLWCVITYEKLQEPRDERGRYAARTLETIKADHQRFVADGSNLKKAKLFNNAITDHFFDIPVDHVCMLQYTAKLFKNLI